jgi:phosphoglycerate kinase
LIKQCIKILKNLQIVQNVNSEEKLAVILGGSKVSDKIFLIMNLLSKARYILIGGGMAYTFMAAKGLPVGKSIVENEFLEIAKDILLKAKQLGVHILLPQDHVVSTSINDLDNVDLVEKIDNEMMGLDIGINTVLYFAEVFNKVDKVFWNGPLGVCEIDLFSQGTKELAKYLSKLCKNDNFKAIIGGGDTAAAIIKAGLQSFFTHISTGGGASLEFMEGKMLPGIKVLLK